MRTGHVRLRSALPIAAVLAGLVLGGCAAPPTAEPAGDEKVATVEPIAGTDRATVTLSEIAAKRLGIATGVVADAVVRGQPRVVVPYDAVVYDPEGATFAYENPEPLVYSRVPLAVEFVEGDMAVLSSGPPAGTTVVTVGVSELLGTEYGVGGE
jgi:hypothetical protein